MSMSNKMNYKIRKTNSKDVNSILVILEKCNLGTATQKFANYVVAEIDDKIVGVVEIIEADNFYFLSNLGVHPEHQKTGIASKLLETALRFSQKDTYLYTVIPTFFSKRGFIITDFQHFLPSQNTFDCKDCDRNKCKCMVKYAHEPSSA